MVELPADVLLLVCEELGNRQDLRTLLNCALSSKTLVHLALLCLYRVHNQSVYFRNEDTETELPGAQKHTWEDGIALRHRYISRWAILWKSIIKSSLGSTKYPYALYIKSLDLRNLETLLDEPQFRELSLETFFADDMSQFLTSVNATTKYKTRTKGKFQIRLNTSHILEFVGESITRYVGEAADRNNSAVVLEDIAGKINNTALLSRWVGRLSRLKSMTLWDGTVLNATVAAAINENCPNFDDLTFCLPPSVDSELASFFSELRSNSLQSFEAISAQSIGPETLLSLNNHSGSLKALKLKGLQQDAIKNISLLQGCELLESLHLEDSEGFIDLEATNNDTFLEVIAWLGRSVRLQELTLQNILGAPAILTDICLRNHIQLRKLEVVNYPFVSSQGFHRAITHQTSLECLRLEADAEGSFRDDIDILVGCVSQLVNLKDLNLVRTSEYFKSFEIRQLASSLPKLEQFTFTGFDLTDNIWPSIASLHHLRGFTCHGLTSFTFDGLLSFIDTLQPSNQGLVLTVFNQNRYSDLEDLERSIIQDAINAKIGGRFEFELYRENDSDSESDSD